MNVQDFYPVFLQASAAVIDHRKVQKNDIFFAFSGEKFNGAQFAEIAINEGAAAAIVEDPAYENAAKKIFYVSSTLDFLQNLAKFHRNKIQIPVIGLTGSNGKTTTKELIHAVLSEKYSVQYTQGNLNNHIGVPLSVLSVKAQHEMAVIEMGANHQKEIAALCEICQPDFGYITNFGKAHLEGFGGFEGVIKGKSELYDDLKKRGKTMVVNTDDAMQMEKTKGYEHTISFGKNSGAYIFAEFAKENKVGLLFENTTAISQLTGNYNFPNLCAAAALGLHFGVSAEKIKAAIEKYQPTNMRSQIVKKADKTLVLDTYNANPSSMTASLQNFKNFEGSKTIIIGDMLELGEVSEAEHRSILELAKSCDFHQIITVGPIFYEVNKDCKAFKNTDDLIEYLKANSVQSDNILLKASRGIALEKAADFI